MRRLILLVILIGCVTPSLSHAELWRCSRSDGTDLYTDRQKDPATCQKYEPTADLGYVSGLLGQPPAPPPRLQRELPPPEQPSPGQDRPPRSFRDRDYPPGDDGEYFEEDPYGDYDPGYFYDSYGYYSGGIFFPTRRRPLHSKSQRNAAHPEKAPPASPSSHR